MGNDKKKPYNDEDLSGFKNFPEGVIGRRAGSSTDEEVRSEAATARNPKANEEKRLDAVIKSQEEQIQKNTERLNALKTQYVHLNRQFQALIKIRDRYKIKTDELGVGYQAEVRACTSQMMDAVRAISQWTILEAEGRVLSQSVQVQIQLINFIRELEAYFLNLQP